MVEPMHPLPAYLQLTMVRCRECNVGQKTYLNCGEYSALRGPPACRDAADTNHGRACHLTQTQLIDATPRITSSPVPGRLCDRR